MTYYDDLRLAYTKRADEDSEYRIGAARYIQLFTNAFREFLGAPQEYLSSDRIKKYPYVQLSKVVENSSGQNVLEAASFLDALQREDDGFFSFGIRLALERAPDVYPKLIFGYHARFLPKQNKCELRIAGKTFYLIMGDDSARVPVFEHMRDSLLNSMRRKPWEMDEKSQIGFVHSQTE